MEHFTLKLVADPANQPEWYLGEMIGKCQSPDGSEAWCMPADDYCLSKAIPTVEESCDKKLHKKFNSPLPSDYHAKVDMTPLLHEDDVCHPCLS
jgi:hypothetical protein